MKTKLFLFLLITAASLGANAQNLDEGIKMYNYERFQTAEKILTPLAATNPRANYYLGLAQLSQDNLDAAGATFNKYPDDPANLAGQARVAFARKNNTEGDRLAKLVASKASKKNGEPYELAAQAYTYSENSNAQSAIDLYKQAVDKGINDDQLNISYGDAYQRIQGGGGEAMNHYEKVTSANPQNSLAYSRIGALWYAAKIYKDALANYEKAKNADPNNPLPYRDLANAYFYVKKYDLAKENIEKYLALSDKSCKDKTLYANILFLAKDYTNATSQMQDVMNTCSGKLKPYMFRVLGYSQYENKSYSDAAMNMEHFFGTSATGTSAADHIIPSDYLYYGKILLANKNVDSADYFFNKSVSIDSSRDKSDTYRQIAESFKDLKTEQGYKKAGYWYTRLVTENPNAAAIDYYYSGFWDFYGNELSNAASQFEKMEAKYPDQPSATYWRGRIAAAQDKDAQTGAAVPFYTKWLSNSDTATPKKADALMQAYQYLSYYYYNKKEKANAEVYIDKILGLEPNNDYALKLRKALATGGAKK